jgi:uncharacterized membrane-anchored protein
MVRPTKRALAFWLAVAVQVAVLVAVPLPKVHTLRSGRTVFLQVAPVDPYSLMSGYYATLSYDASLPGAYYPQKTCKPEETTQALVREYMGLMGFSVTSATLAQLGLTMDDVRRAYPHAYLTEDHNRTGSQVGKRWLDGEGRLTTAALEQIHAGVERALMRTFVETPFRDGDTVYAVLEARGEGEPWRPVRLTGTLPRELPPDQVALRARFTAWQLDFGLDKFFIPESERDEVEQALATDFRRARAEIRVDKSGNSALVALHIGEKVWRTR